MADGEKCGLAQEISLFALTRLASASILTRLELSYDKTVVGDPIRSQWSQRCEHAEPSTNMSYAAGVLRVGIHKTLAAQVVLVLGLAAVYLVLKGGFHALCVLYGGGTALVVTSLLGWRIQQAGESAQAGFDSSSVLLYASTLERLALVGLSVGVGIGWLKLDPIALIAGFAIAQLGYLARGTGRLGNNKSVE